MNRIRLLILCGMVLSPGIGALAQEPQPQPQPQPERRRVEPDPSRFPVNPQPTENFERRRRALERLAITGTLVPERLDPRGPDLEIVWREQAREDIMALAAGLQGLYDLGGSADRDDAFHQALEDGTEESVEAIGGLLGFINRGTDPPAPEPPDVPDEDFDARVRRLVEVYLSILDPAAELIGGDILDLGKLEQVRSGLLEIQTLTLSLDETLR